MKHRPVSLLNTVLGAATDRKMQRLANRVKAAWRGEARRALDTTYAAYQKAMSVNWAGPRFTMQLSGTVPNMVEWGLGPDGIGSKGRIDLRTWLLKPGKAKISKQGFSYRAIPMGRTTKQIAQWGGQRAVAAARALGPKQALPKGMAPKMVAHDRYRRDTLGRFYVQHAHKTDALAGLRKMPVRGGGKYGVFRTISNKSKRGWYHPGIRARRIIDKVLRQMPVLLRQSRW